MVFCAGILLAASACGSGPATGGSVPATSASAGSSPTSAVGATVVASTADETSVEPVVPSTTTSHTTQPASTSQYQPAGPRIVIVKSARRLDLYSGGVLLHTFRIALGFAPEGDKEREGDGRTPEGEFYVCVKNPESKFGLSLGVSYPSVDDAERGLREGLIDTREYGRIIAAIDAGQTPPMKTALGGEIYIHAGGSEEDWTQGCVGLDKGDMEELYEAVEVGTPIVIRP